MSRRSRHHVAFGRENHRKGLAIDEVRLHDQNLFPPATLLEHDGPPLYRQDRGQTGRENLWRFPVFIISATAADICNYWAKRILNVQKSKGDGRTRHTLHNDFNAF